MVFVKLKERNFVAFEQKLISISDADDELYDKAHFSTIRKQIMVDEAGNVGVFKVFAYRNSLRFFILLQNSPCEPTIEWLVSEIETYVHTTDKLTILLWYAQRNIKDNDFTDTVIKRLPNTSNPYHFYKYEIPNDEINADVDMKGLQKRKCTEDMIDTCIDIMEDLFTPFPDSPGCFREDSERIKMVFLDYKHSGTELFFKDNELVGFCGHHNGHFNEVCVCEKFQGKGYGEIIVRSVLESIYSTGFDACLTTGNYNSRAVGLYEKVGFKRVYESIRITIMPARVNDN